MALELDLERGSIQGKNLLPWANYERNSVESGGLEKPEKTNDHKVKKSAGNKKHPKPPRHPRGPTLDAADVELIKELTRLAMLKREKIERIKELRKMKTDKTLALSKTNVFAILVMLTVLIFYLFISQGMLSFRVGLACVEGTNVLAVENDFFSGQFGGYSSVNILNWLGSVSPNLINLVAVSDSLTK